MNISLQKLLIKMEEELRLAKSADSGAALREKIHAIKTLCELVLDEPAQSGYASPTVKEQTPPQPVQSQQSYNQQHIFTAPVQQPSAILPQPKKLKLDDEANGDSLFDF